MTTADNIKDPGAELDYYRDWTQWIEAGDTIATSTWVIEPVGELEAFQDDHDATKATVWLRGGVLGTTYSVTNHITTAGGRKDQRTSTILIQER